jgi:hypothetical protein
MKYTLRNYISGVGLKTASWWNGVKAAMPYKRDYCPLTHRANYTWNARSRLITASQTLSSYTNDYERSLHESIMLPTWDLVTADTDLPFAITEFLQVFRVCLELTN